MKNKYTFEVKLVEGQDPSEIFDYDEVRGEWYAKSKLWNTDQDTPFDNLKFGLKTQIAKITIELVKNKLKEKKNEK